MKKKILLVICFCVAAASVSYGLKAQTKPSGYDSDIEQQLNLTDSQKAKLKELRGKFRIETKEINSEIKRLLDEERAIKKESPTNQAALKAVLKERAEKEVELSLALNKFEEQQLAVLNAEQKQTLKKLKSEKEKKQD